MKGQIPLLDEVLNLTGTHLSGFEQCGAESGVVFVGFFALRKATNQCVLFLFAVPVRVQVPV